MEKRLKERLEELIDEGSGAVRSVIVQMRTDDIVTKKLLKTASQAMRSRLMSSSARDMLPPKADAMKFTKAGKHTSASVKHLRANKLSMAAQIGLYVNSLQTRAALESLGLASLAPLIDSVFVQSAMDRIATTRISKKRKGKSKTSKKDSIPHFWSSASAVIELDKDDVWNLPDNVAGIVDIYPNRRVTVPPVVDATPSSLTQNIIENMASAWGIQSIGALSVWGAYGARGKGIKICVLDTGIDTEHPDLAGKLSKADWAEFDERGDIVTDSSPYDSGEHGTHCAGIVAGGNASGQWIGVAPEASLSCGLVLKGGAGTTAQILAGMQWAIDQSVDIISMSLGGLQMSSDVIDTYTRQIITANQLGIPVVVAIGNEGSQTTGAPGNDYFSFAVGATDAEDRAVGFSGGRTQVVTQSRFIPDEYLPLSYSKPEVTAPGVAIKSAIPGSKYASWNGTSMAAPHVAGAMALLLSATNIKQIVPPNELAYVLQDLITGSVDELGESGKDHRYGFGRIDVLRAIGFAKDRGY